MFGVYVQVTYLEKPATQYESVWSWMVLSIDRWIDNWN